MKTIVFDIDGTLSIVGDRVKCLDQDPPNWDEFYERCGEDLPNSPVIQTLKALFHHPTVSYEIILLTGRRESVREKTVEWLRKHNLWHDLDYDLLLMRPDGDFRHDTEVKPELLEKYGLKPDLVFEDRNSMVAKWREMGIPCFQVADGDF